MVIIDLELSTVYDLSSKVQWLDIDYFPFDDK